MEYILLAVIFFIALIIAAAVKDQNNGTLSEISKTAAGIA